MNKLNFAKRACAVLALCAATAITLQAQTFGVLHRFDGTDGGSPVGPLVQGTDGNLYGTTQVGGAYGAGTVFKITPSGILATLYSFCSQSGCTDGEIPDAALIQATDGNFYGTTRWGGAFSEGTVFRITPSGTPITLYSFCSQSGCMDGAEPGAPLMQASDGNFYGTTESGGAFEAGAVFKITSSGTFTTLYSFCTQSNCTDGVLPEAGLIQATGGNLYGTTVEGGAYGWGTVFKVTPRGTLATLYSFCSQTGCPDGAWPSAALIQATDGNFYGTTATGGADFSGCDGYGCGTVFKMTPGGTLATLHSFCSQSDCGDGADPESALIQATDGNFYGTTWDGALDGVGTVFEITPSGALTTLHKFHGTDGADPDAALLQDTNGNFYGTTVYGGADGWGAVFVLTTGLGPFVETEPNHGKPGRVIQILGTNLGGATSVTFNGTPAAFKVFSYSLIGAVVPAGATTGTVQVTTPSGVLSSNIPFTVGQ